MYKIFTATFYVFRIASVCDFVTYCRYVTQGLVKSHCNEVYWQIMSRQTTKLLWLFIVGVSIISIPCPCLIRQGLYWTQLLIKIHILNLFFSIDVMGWQIIVNIWEKNSCHFFYFLPIIKFLSFIIKPLLWGLNEFDYLTGRSRRKLSIQYQNRRLSKVFL